MASQVMANIWRSPWVRTKASRILIGRQDSAVVFILTKWAEQVIIKMHSNFVTCKSRRSMLILLEKRMSELILSTCIWAVYKHCVVFLKQPCLKLLSTTFSIKEFRSHKFIQSAWGHRINMCYSYHLSRTTLLVLKDCCVIQWAKIRGQISCAAP